MIDYVEVFNRDLAGYCDNSGIEFFFEYQQGEQFYHYMKSILKWNEVINLTAIKNEDEFIVKHYVDSLTALREIEFYEQEKLHNNINDNNRIKLLDLGTGAGFPGVPLKIARSDIDITLIDSVQKKLNCVKDSCEKSKIEDVKIIHTRAEDLQKQKEYNGKFDIVTTRAVSNMTNLANWMLPFLKKGGIAICMKGPNYKEELEEAKTIIEKHGCIVEKIDTFNIEDNERNNIIIRKK
jgi:16S rRNA (guanine527-N7)-methyltransferase